MTFTVLCCNYDYTQQPPLERKLPGRSLQKEKASYLMVGSGLPPELVQDSWNGLSSVAVGLSPGLTEGAEGAVRTVTVNDCECRSLPLPTTFRRHSNWPLSRSKEAFEMSRS